MTSFFVTKTPAMKPQATVQDLKTRLDWGEPALTIVDVRDRAAFNQTHIQGAVSIPMAVLVDVVSSNLELERDIYVYGDSDEMASTAAGHLRDAGFQKVAELSGGLTAWKTAKYPVEGV